MKSRYEILLENITSKFIFKIGPDYLLSLSIMNNYVYGLKTCISGVIFVSPIKPDFRIVNPMIW